MSTLSFVLFFGTAQVEGRTESSPYLFYLFYKSTIFCFYCECRPTQIKVNLSNCAGVSRGKHLYSCRIQFLLNTFVLARLLYVLYNNAIRL